MSEYSKFTKDVVIVGLTQVAIALRGFILLPIISKLLGVEDYGIWAQFTITSTLLEPLILMGLTISLVRFLPAKKAKHEVQEGFYSVLIATLLCSLLFGVILVVFGSQLTRTFFGGSDVKIIYILAATFPFSAIFAVCTSYFLAFRQMRLFGILSVGKHLGGVAVVALLVAGGAGIVGAVLSFLIVAIVASGIAMWIIAAQIGVSFPRFTHLKQYLKLGLPFVPNSLFGWIVHSSDRYVISYFLGIAEVGIYSAVYTISNLTAYFRTPLVQVLRPALSKAYDEHRIAEVKDYLRYSVKYFLMLTIPSTVGLTLIGKELLRTFATGEFLSFNYLIVPLILAGEGLVLGLGTIIAGSILVLVEKPNSLVVGTIAGGLASISLNLAFVPHYGLMAAAVSTLVANLISAGIVLYSALRYLRFQSDYLFLLKSVAASAVMSVLILLINPTGIWEILLAVVLGALVYSMALFMLRGFSRNEMRFFSRLVAR